MPLLPARQGSFRVCSQTACRTVPPASGGSGPYSGSRRGTPALFSVWRSRRLPGRGARLPPAGERGTRKRRRASPFPGGRRDRRPLGQDCKRAWTGDLDRAGADGKTLPVMAVHAVAAPSAPRRSGGWKTGSPAEVPVRSPVPDWRAAPGGRGAVEDPGVLLHRRARYAGSRLHRVPDRARRGV